MSFLLIVILRLLGRVMLSVVLCCVVCSRIWLIDNTLLLRDRYRLSKVPEIFALSLKRYDNQNQKDESIVDFPDELDLQK